MCQITLQSDGVCIEGTKLDCKMRCNLWRCVCNYTVIITSLIGVDVETYHSIILPDGNKHLYTM